MLHKCLQKVALLWSSFYSDRAGLYKTRANGLLLFRTLHYQKGQNCQERLLLVIVANLHVKVHLS